jgi:glucose/arabinose dehydrogenase
MWQTMQPLRTAMSGAGVLTLVLLASHALPAGAAQQPAPGIPPLALTQPSYSSDTAEQHRLRTVVVARGLNHPFAIALLPDGDALVSERGGKLRLVRNVAGVAGKPVLVEPQEVAGVPAIATPYRNAGLHDLALHPQFAQNRLVYFTFNKPGDAAPAAGAPAAGATARPQSRLTVMRARFDGKALVDAKEIFVGKSSTTSGSRIAFDGNGMLYIVIGAAFGDEAQKMDNTVGKVMRIKDDGGIPADNPFVGKADVSPAVFTFGHRDPLGLTVHPNGTVLAVEHGPNGGDELNVVQAGKNYGWPKVTFGRDYNGSVLTESPVAPDVTPPLVMWSPSIGPSGLVVYTGDRFPAWKNNVFVGSVRRGEIPGTGGLERVVFNDKMQEIRRETLLTDLHHRIRDVRQGRDGLLYVLTDEDDGALLRLEPESAAASAR